MNNLKLSIIFISWLILAPLVGYTQAVGHQQSGVPTNLSDQEKHISENFVHEGLVDRTVREACDESDEMKRACRGDDVDPKVLGISSSMVRALSKAYTMVIGAGLGGELDMAKPDADAAEGGSTAAPETKDAGESTEGSDKNEESDNTDYCKYIAIGTEAVALFQQTMAQDNISKTATNAAQAQKQNLQKAARSHGARAQQAEIQTGGWGATTACYIGMMARPEVSKESVMNWVKMGSATLLTSFFAMQIAEHRKYQKKINQLAKKLPGKGDCNPVTERNCYCAQPETENDPRYCMPEIHQRNLDQQYTRISCINNELKADPKCDCYLANTCYDMQFSSMVSGLNLGEAFHKNAYTPFKNMSQGQLQKSYLTNGALKQAALAQRILRENDEKLSNIAQTNDPLTQEQKEEYEAIKKLGLPLPLARTLATTKLSPEAKKNMAKFNARNLKALASYKPTGSEGNVLTFSGGDGLNAKEKNKDSSSNFDFLKNLQKKKKGEENQEQGEVLMFAHKAQDKAQIHKNEERPIFEIISRRYQISGRRRLSLNE